MVLLQVVTRTAETYFIAGR